MTPIFFVRIALYCTVYIQPQAFSEAQILKILWALSKCSLDIVQILPLLVNRLSRRYGHIRWAMTFACLADLQLIIKAHLIRGVSWKSMETDGKQSVIPAVQPFSYMSQPLLKAGSLTFYPLHVNFLNFIEDMRRVRIVKENAFLVYLPVMLSHTEETLKTGHLNRGRLLNGTESLRIIHECKEHVL